jgi:hypothetical protein
MKKNEAEAALPKKLIEEDKEDKKEDIKSKLLENSNEY